MNNRDNRKFLDYIDRLYDEESNVNGTLFSFITILGIVAIGIATISNILYKMGIVATLITLLADIVLVFIYIMGKKTKKYERWTFFLMMLLNIVVMPIAFFASGGYKSGMPSWLLLCLMVIFYLLRGKYLIIATIVTALADASCFMLAYRYPGLVNDFDSEYLRYIDIALALTLIGIMLCLFMMLQNYYNEREKEINRLQKEELENALKARNRFLANMSHEIRTPINTIIGLNEMTLREQISDEVAENSVNIERASKMLLSLINDILDLSKIESGRMELTETEYSLGDMLSDIVNINWIRAQSKNLEFRISVSPEIPNRLIGDDNKIKQIITNLVSNAIKYTEQGTVVLAIDLEKVSDKFINLRIDVTDTGMGIRNEDIRRLFDDFSRVNLERTRGIEGTGLGLAICKQLVDLMGGTIAVDSIFRKGSTFSVSLPQKVANLDPIGDLKIGHLSENKREKYVKRFEAPEARVLVVDDNDMNLLVAKKLLRDVSVKLDLARSGEECLQYTMRNSYDLILLDHLMPHMDGIETLDRIRNQSGGFCKTTPVVALTANDIAGAREDYIKVGFTDFLPKPISGEMLENTLLELLPIDKIEYTAKVEESVEADIVQLVNSKRKKKLIIATDNSADLPETIIRQLGISIINHYVVTDYGKFLDNREIYTDSLLDYLKSNNRATGEPPTVEDFEKFFGNLLDEAENVIYISISSKTYEGYFNAYKAGRSFAHVTVIDSLHLAGGMGIMAIEAAKMAIDDKPINEIIDKISDMRARVHSGFIIDDPKQLYNSRLLPAHAYRMAKLLNLHIVLELKNGKITPVRLYAGNSMDAYRRYVKRTLKKYPVNVEKGMFFENTDCPVGDREVLKDIIKKEYSDLKIIEMQAASSITVHSGAGCIGLFFEKADK